MNNLIKKQNWVWQSRSFDEINDLINFINELKLDSHDFVITTFASAYIYMYFVLYKNYEEDE